MKVLHIDSDEHYEQPYGNLVQLNRSRVLADAVGEDVLREIAHDYLDLLGTSSAIYETNGDYALGIFSSGWCRFLDQRSRELCGTPDNAEALANGRWICHEECWNAARLSMEKGEPVDVECPGGIRLYAVPIFAGGEIVGSINFGYGDPPSEAGALGAVGGRYQAGVEQLKALAQSYESRPPEVIELAKRRLRTSARLIGALIEHKRAEDRLRRLQAVTEALARAVTTEEVLDAIITEVKSATGAGAALLLLPAPDRPELIAPRIAGYPPEIAEQYRRVPLDSPLPAAQAFRTGGLVAGEDRGAEHDPPMPEGPEGAMIALPLTVGGRAIGGLGLRFPGRRRFGREDRDVLLTVGRQCGQAIERARAHDAERRLLASVSQEKRRLEEIFSALPAYFALYTGSEHVLEFSNPANIRLRGGWNPIGQPLREAFPGLRAEAYAAWDRVYRTGQPLRIAETTPASFPGSGGDERVFDLSLLPRRNAEGRITGVLAFATDVTEKTLARCAEEQAHQTLRQQAELISLSHDAIIAADACRVITSWNTGAERMYGYTAQEAVGRVIHELLATRSPVSLEQMHALLREHGRWEGELTHIRKDGEAIIVESRQVQDLDSEGRPTGFLEINRDITERKSAVESLRKSEEWLKFAQKTAGIGIFDWDIRLDRAAWSEEQFRIYGLEDGGSAPLTRAAWEQHVHPDDREEIRRSLDESLANRQPWEVAYRIIRPDGAVRWLNAKGAVLVDKEGRPARLIGATLDITEQRNAEEAHRNAQKLESIGVLAGGIAHDFNNLLTSIMGNASLVMEEVAGEIRERTQAIINGAGRAADLTRQLLAYAGKGRFVIRDIDLGGAVREITPLLRMTVPRNVNLDMALADSLPPVRADAGQLQQVIMNLVINGAEAIGEQRTGTVTVQTHLIEAPAPFPDGLAGQAPPGRYVVLEVRDTGSGMDEATRAKIFDPFFSTKFLGRGLGLAAVSGVVRSHKGAIAVESAPGRGSTFRVLFPAGASSAKPEPAVRPAPAAAAAGTVLVVDDEEYVRSFIAGSLERAGYTPLLAGNGREAIGQLERHPETDLVILDLMMPELGGADALREIRARKSGIPVLVTSGYDQSEARRLCADYGLDDFIQKPYTAKNLTAKVGELMKRARA
ncbi:MAG: PAS domain S-box protein [Bryobacteraceae bacterium]